jgi:hypothetical protein
MTKQIGHRLVLVLVIDNVSSFPHVYHLTAAMSGQIGDKSVFSNRHR